MAPISKRRLRHNDYNVAIVCPLMVEMNAVRYILDEEHHELAAKDGDPNKYIFGQMGPLNVVIGYLPQGSQGIGAAATVATHMKRSFPSAGLRLLVGIGGGIPTVANDVRLGDVVIGMPDGAHGGVVQYDLGKETVTDFVRKGHLDNTPQEWRNAIVKLESDHLVVDNKILTFVSMLRDRSAKLSQAYKMPEAERDIRSPTNKTHMSGCETCTHCEPASPVLKSKRDSDIPAIFYGTIASGDRVIKSAEKRDLISKDLGGALCFEMEAAGLVNDFPCIVVRGIADYADSHKNDDWHGYAAATAAGCAKELLTYMKAVAGDSGHVNYSTIPSLRVTGFIGREKQISEMKAYFEEGLGTDEPRTLVLSAMGGQGKSQTALEYCRQMKTVYHGLFWVDASSRSTAVLSFGQIASTLGAGAQGVENDEDKVQFVLQKMEDPAVRWLLVFDNYDSPADFAGVKDFIPTAGSVHVLFTSRYRDLARLGKVMTIPPLLPVEEIQLLLRVFEKSDIAKHATIAHDIVDRLGHLALAIDQAASWIQYRRLTIGQLGEFLRAYELEREKILNFIPKDFWEYGSATSQGDAERQSLSAFTTWEMSFQQLCGAIPGHEEDAAHFFTVSAFLAPIPIDDWIFRNHWEMGKKPPKWMRMFTKRSGLTDDAGKGTELTVQLSSEHQQSDGPGVHPDHNGPAGDKHPGGDIPKPNWNYDKYWNLIERADSYSLVQSASTEWQNGEHRVKFVLHPLIRDWLQLRQHSAERHALTQETMSVVIHSLQFIDMTPNTIASIRETMTLQMDASLHNDVAFSEEGHRLGEEMASCSNARWYARSYTSQGRHDTSHELWTKIHDTNKLSLGETHENTLRAASELGDLLLNQGKYSEAQQRLGDLLPLQQELLGLEHADTLATTKLLAYSFQKQAKHEQAEKLYRNVLEIEEAILETTDHARQETMRYLARVLYRQYKYQEAEGILRDLFQLRSRLYGLDDRSTISIKDDLATVLLAQGEVEEAQSMLEGVLDVRVRILGPNHSDTLVAKHTLARTYKRQEKYAEARVIYEDVLETSNKVYATNHPEVLKIRKDLAGILRRQGEFEKAEVSLREILRISRRVLGPEHESTLKVAHDLAHTLKVQDKYEEAETIFRDVLAAEERTLGKMGRSSLPTMEDLGTMFTDMKRYTEARKLLEDALSGYKQMLGPDHQATCRCRNNLERLQDKMEKAGSGSKVFKRKEATRTETAQKAITHKEVTPEATTNFHGSHGSNVSVSSVRREDSHGTQHELHEILPARTSRRKEFLRKLPVLRKRIKDL